jgi:[protein-PII] uridylyltransferase
LVAQVSDIPATDLPPLPLAGDDALVAAIRAGLPPGADPRAVRAATVRHLSAWRAQESARLTEAFAATPRSARTFTRALAGLTDRLVQAAFALATTDIHPLPTPTGGRSRHGRKAWSRPCSTSCGT